MNPAAFVPQHFQLMWSLLATTHAAVWSLLAGQGRGCQSPVHFFLLTGAKHILYPQPPTLGAYSMVDTIAVIIIKDAQS